jgi:transcriptional regulator with XRE-family HTH domain
VTRKTKTEFDDARLKALGAAITQLRKDRQTSQEALALQANIDRSHMGKIERGERNVTALNLLRIADALGIKASDILAGADI